MYAEAARRAFQAGHVQLGADCLRSQNMIVASSGNSNSQADTLLNPTQMIAQKLLAMKPQERHELLAKLAWTMPTLGLSQCSRFNAHETIPTLFMAEQSRDGASRSPCRQVVTEDAMSVSLLEWAMRDALA